MMLHKCGRGLWSIQFFGFIAAIILLMEGFLSQDIFMHPMHTVNFVLTDALPV